MEILTANIFLTLLHTRNLLLLLLFFQLFLSSFINFLRQGKSQAAAAFSALARRALLKNFY
jgi:hypothetical protein